MNGGARRKDILSRFAVTRARPRRLARAVVRLRDGEGEARHPWGARWRAGHAAGPKKSWRTDSTRVAQRGFGGMARAFQPRWVGFEGDLVLELRPCRRRRADDSDWWRSTSGGRRRTLAGAQRFATATIHAPIASIVSEREKSRHSALLAGPGDRRRRVIAISTTDRFE